MRAVIQRVKQASVAVNGGEPRRIGVGLAVLIAVAPDDTIADLDYMAEKIAGLRVFEDADGKMNLSVKEVANGACLVVSQFTLYGDVRRGKRPSFIAAAQPDVAIPLYEKFVECLRNVHNLPVETGEFGADMMVEIHNDGPVTILLDSKKLF
ncbi:MAG TPA: D-aminoacyl-tRNA deacylase [Capsulimonadaceae bacterium]|jgi:D-tyrosyl-tRNA(Tyr) deacylase